MTQLVDVVLARRSLRARILIGLGCAVIAAGVRLLLEAALRGQAVWQPFALAVLAAALAGGSVSAATALGASVIVVEISYLGRVDGVSPPLSSHLVSLALFAAVATSIAWIAIRLRRALAELSERATMLGTEVESGERTRLELATENVALAQLNAIGDRYASAGASRTECLEGTLAAAMAITGARRGSLQLYNGDSETLRLVAHEGLPRPFTEFFATVRDATSACGLARSAGERVVVEDVRDSAVFAGQPSRQVLLDAGIRAVQSTPLTSSKGHVLGIVSTHFDEPRRLSAREGVVLDLLSRQAADYLERKGTEETVRSATEQLQLVTESMAVPVTRCSRDLRYVWVSKPYAEWLGRTVDEITGRAIIDVIGAEAFARLRPYFERVLRGEVVRYEEQVPFHGIGARWVMATYTPTTDERGACDGWVAVVIDIDERTRMEQAVRTSERALEHSVALLETLLSAAPIGFALLDREHRWVRINRAAAEMDGIPIDGHLGKRVAELLPDVGQTLEALLEEVWRSGEPVVNREVSGRTLADPHHDRHWLASYYPVRTASGEVLGVGAVAWDVTAQKRADLALREADQRKDEFLAMLAHELRNPLAPIRNSVEVLRALGPDDERLIRARDLIDRQVTHLSRLVDDLLDVSRITRGKITLQRAPIRLAQAVEEAVETAQPSIAERNHTLSVTLGSAPLLVHADRARLVQVIANLLTNAAKFTPRGGHITVSVGSTDGREAIIQVRDTGVGIPKELHDQIFELFRQEERSLARSQGGLGIGLTLVKRLVELHGGRVEVRSDGYGAGSEFTITLPLADALEPAPRSVPIGDGSSTSSTGLRVLVVEDNADAAESFKVVLELAGHQVRVASSGLEALRALDDFEPTVAFVDLGLPQMNGFEVARRLRADPRTTHTVLVALTGYGRDEDKEEGRRAGFDHHLVKPVEINTVMAVLATVIVSVPRPGIGPHRTVH